MVEEWKNIVINGIDYTGYYSISNMGRVRSERYGRILKNSRNCKGYVTRCLSVGCFRKVYQLHRLVATLFIDNQNNYPEVNHKDGNKLNNCIHNLEWCTRSENQKHYYHHNPEILKFMGGKVDFKLGGNPRAKKVVNMETGDIYGCAVEAASVLGVNKRTLQRKLSGYTPNNTSLVYLN